MADFSKSGKKQKLSHRNMPQRKSNSANTIKNGSPIFVKTSSPKEMKESPTRNYKISTTRAYGNMVYNVTQNWLKPLTSSKEMNGKPFISNTSGHRPTSMQRSHALGHLLRKDFTQNGLITCLTTSTRSREGQPDTSHSQWITTKHCWIHSTVCAYLWTKNSSHSSAYLESRCNITQKT